MTTMQMDRMAYNGEPSPNGLNHLDLSYYREVRKLYADLANKVITVEQGKAIKAEIIEAYNLALECMEGAKDER